MLWYFRRLEWCVALINRYLPSHPISWLCCLTSQLTSGISSHWDTNTASSCRFGTWNRCFVDLPLEIKFSQFSAIESLFKENFNLVCHCVFGRSWFRDRFNTFHPPPPTKIKHGHMTHIKARVLEFLGTCSSWFMHSSSLWYPSLTFTHMFRHLILHLVKSKLVLVRGQYRLLYKMSDFSPNSSFCLMT